MAFDLGEGDVYIWRIVGLVIAGWTVLVCCGGCLCMWCCNPKRWMGTEEYEDYAVSGARSMDEYLEKKRAKAAPASSEMASVRVV